MEVNIDAPARTCVASAVFANPSSSCRPPVDSTCSPGMHNRICHRIHLRAIGALPAVMHQGGEARFPWPSMQVATSSASRKSRKHDCLDSVPCPMASESVAPQPSSLLRQRSGVWSASSPKQLRPTDAPALPRLLAESACVP